MMQAMGTTDWKYSAPPLVDGERVIVSPGIPDVDLPSWSHPVIAGGNLYCYDIGANQG